MLLPSLIGQQFSTTVSRAFTERRDRRIQLFNANGRSDELRAIHADCEFFEDYLINQPGSEWDPPMQNCMAYDAIHREIGRVEFKCSSGTRITLVDGREVLVAEYPNDVYDKIMAVSCQWI